MVGSIFLATLLDWQVRTVILQSIWRADTERTHNLYVHYSHKAQLNFWGFIFLLKIYILKLITYHFAWPAGPALPTAAG